ncbi:MAG: hypothetical protein ABI693_05370 [Bryobacteraceae bacterium]
MMLSRCAILCLLVIPPVFGADPALTIYNQNFAVIRETIPLTLKAGTSSVNFSGATAHVEPDSVMLRDPSGKNVLRVLEQNYRNDPISQDLLLKLNEGKTIDFLVSAMDGSRRLVRGRIVRSGYVPHWEAMQRFGAQYQASQSAMVSGGAGQPLIEVDGKLQFSRPGQPLFPSLEGDTILQPTLTWMLYSPQAAKFDAELSYVSGGMSWNADYNVIAPEVGDTLELVGWVTLENQCGRPFEHARIKLMAGEVNKIQPGGYERLQSFANISKGAVMPGPVTEKEFEDYHLYSLPEATTLLDRETKQVEFFRGAGIQSRRYYVYDGLRLTTNYSGYQDFRNIYEIGSLSNPHVRTMREFANSKANHLGVPLPKGRVRFYRRDQDGQMEFTGENEIDHTPKDEMVRVYIGNAFDLTGEHRRTHFEYDQSRAFVDEAYEVKVRNHKNEAATVRVVEHLFRWSTWKITQESMQHRQLDSSTIEYEVTLQPNEEKIVTYTAHYSW